ncbi:MAG: type II toxin-antitoxin system VapC family toxin [Calditrichaeota bacterium]|nr:MAG: type II toxin-antitoxin system VapC family toxin [Calditrichota bacterium]MBL1204952.1 type II toxin-antitoxin system VapC family toxin [Calditrichota bacterium]NOG44780.1 type II toxin-antitoxin system VapC family toxin [Calditrichota bacterium]
MTFTLDTNTLIYFFKGLGNIADNLLSKSPSEILIPSIVLFELEFGIVKSSKPEKRRKQLNQLLSSLKTLPFSQKEAKQAAIIKAELESKGTPIGPMDTLIAATAMASNSTLVTHNTKEFSRIENLKIEDWF